jgi:threonine aldolase
MDWIDLRSDTLTCPTDRMRRAMAEAQVGDDVFGEDPTVRRLEQVAAERTGKQAALFVTSGTMANLVCQMVHCRRGDEMIVGDQAHIFYYEQGGSAAIAGIHPRPVPNQPDGRLLPEHIEAAVRPDDVHFPRSRLIALENTHNRCYGSPLDAGYIQSIVALAGKHHMKVHVDGARLFNAAAALNTPVHELAAGVDSVCFCLSKGLGAPVGSVVCGSTEFIQKARRVRKVLGGGMRQAGVLAAAGIVALDEMVFRLAEDHANAQRLAAHLAGITGIQVELERVRTNIVFIRADSRRLSAAQLVQRLEQRNVRVLATGVDTIRAVTHFPIDPDKIDRAATAFRQSLRDV